MNRREFSKIALVSTLPLMSFNNSTWSVHLVRHATLLIKGNGYTFLVDPMLSSKGAMDPVANAGNDIRIPMADLPFPADDVLKDLDGVFVTHTHRDHWDAEASKAIEKATLLVCQSQDGQKLRDQRFFNINDRDELALRIGAIRIYRTRGQHGTGEIGQKMGPVSGFVFDLNGQKVYVAGDTIWCPEVESAMKTYKPQIIVVNAGGAQFLTGGPITMTAEDVKTVAEAMPDSKVIAVHMDTVNHCNVTRVILKEFVAKNKLKNVLIPADGETLTF